MKPSPSTEGDRSVYAASISWADGVNIAVATVAALILLLLTILAFNFLPKVEPIKILVLSLSVTAGVMTIVAYPPSALYGFVIACMVFPHEIEELYVSLGFMKVYVHDVAFLLFAAYALLRWVQGKLDLHQIQFNRIMLRYIIVGVVAAGIGLLKTGNQYDNVFGDFRRSFFYFLAYYFGMIFTGSRKQVCYLRMALVIGAVGAILKGYSQMATGAFVSRRIGDSAHVLTHFEVTFLTFAVYFALTKVALKTKRSVLWLILAALGTALVITGNFRTCWVGFSAGLVTLSLFLPSKQRLRLWSLGLIGVLAGAIILFALWDMPVEETHSTLGQNIAEKASIANATSDPNIGWRLDSYRNAIELWQSQPLLGRGLGEELEFITATSTGSSMMATGHRVHNSYLWLLMSLGVVGFAVIAYVHFIYLKTIYSASRVPLRTETQLMLYSGTALYITILVSACFDVYLESAPPIIVLSCVMAACLLAIRYDAHIKISDHAIPA